MAEDKKKEGILSEFKKFALRGNVIDLAVGVIIGGAFQKIVTSVINDLIMPFVGLFSGGTNFSDKFVVLKYPTAAEETYLTLKAAQEAGATVFAYGAFITAVIDFLIMAVIIFLMVKVINKITSVQKKKEEAAPATKKCPYCLSEIAIQATRCPHCTSQIESEE